MSSTEILSDDNLRYHPRVSELTDEEVEVVATRIERATITDVLEVEVDRVNGHRRVTVWATSVKDDSSFYDEWYSEKYKVGSSIVEVDIQ